MVWWFDPNFFLCGSVFYVKAYLDNDQNALNNIASTTVQVAYETGALIINEILYRPVSGQAEWIELFNPGDQTVDIQFWFFSVQISKKGCRTMLIRTCYLIRLLRSRNLSRVFREGMGRVE